MLQKFVFYFCEMPLVMFGPTVLIRLVTHSVGSHEACLYGVSACQLFYNLTNTGPQNHSNTAEGHFQWPYLLLSSFSLSILGMKGSGGNL